MLTFLNCILACSIFPPRLTCCSTVGGALFGRRIRLRSLTLRFNFVQLMLDVQEQPSSLRLVNKSALN